MIKKRKLFDPETGKNLICYLAADIDNLLQKIKKLSDKPQSKHTCAPSPLQRLRDINKMLKKS